MRYEACAATWRLPAAGCRVRWAGSRAPRSTVLLPPSGGRAGGGGGAARAAVRQPAVGGLRRAGNCALVALQTAWAAMADSPTLGRTFTWAISVESRHGALGNVMWPFSSGLQWQGTGMGGTMEVKEALHCVLRPAKERTHPDGPQRSGSSRDRVGLLEDRSLPPRVCCFEFLSKTLFAPSLCPWLAPGRRNTTMATSTGFRPLKRQRVE